MAYVYLGAAFVSPAAWIYWGCIEPLINVSSIEIEAFRRANPQLCAGIVPRLRAEYAGKPGSVGRLIL